MIPGWTRSAYSRTVWTVNFALKEWCTQCLAHLVNELHGVNSVWKPFTSSRNIHSWYMMNPLKGSLLSHYFLYYRVKTINNHRVGLGKGLLSFFHIVMLISWSLISPFRANFQSSLIFKTGRAAGVDGVFLFFLNFQCLLPRKLWLPFWTKLSSGMLFQLLGNLQQLVRVEKYSVLNTLSPDECNSETFGSPSQFVSQCLNCSVKSINLVFFIFSSSCASVKASLLHKIEYFGCPISIMLGLKRLLFQQNQTNQIWLQFIGVLWIKKLPCSWRRWLPISFHYLSSRFSPANDCVTSQVCSSYGTMPVCFHSIWLLIFFGQLSQHPEPRIRSSTLPQFHTTGLIIWLH